MIDLDKLKDLLKQAHDSGHYIRIGEWMSDNAEAIAAELEAGRALAEAVRKMDVIFMVKLQCGALNATLFSAIMMKRTIGLKKSSYA